jgi:hypothetical protein
MKESPMAHTGRVVGRGGKLLTELRGDPPWRPYCEAFALRCNIVDVIKVKCLIGGPLMLGIHPGKDLRSPYEFHLNRALMLAGD